MSLQAFEMDLNSWIFQDAILFAGSADMSFWTFEWLLEAITMHDFVLCLHIKRGCENISLYDNGDVWQALVAAAFTVCFGWQLCTGGL